MSVESLVARAQAAAQRLQEATEALNKSLMAFEQLFGGLRPGWVPIPPFEDRDGPGPRKRLITGHALVWDGTKLLYDTGQHRTPVLRSSRRQRMNAALVIKELFDELSRERVAPRPP